MTTMIEKVARALCVELGEDPDQQTPFHPRISYLWQHYIKAARAAIEAMREPTGAMEHVIYCTDISSDRAVEAAADLWGYAIDAVLKEQP